MFYFTKDAIDFFNERFEREVDMNLSGSAAFKLLDYIYSFWKWNDEYKLKDTAQKAFDIVDEMIQDGDAAEDYENAESAVKESWQENANGEQDDYPNWEDYKKSKYYVNEINFYSEQMWDDFNENHNEYLDLIKNWRDWSDLRYQLRKIKEEIEKIEKEVIKIKQQVRREVIEACFE